MSPRDLFWLIL